MAHRDRAEADERYEPSRKKVKEVVMLKCFFHGTQEVVRHLECQFAPCLNKDLIGPACCQKLEPCPKRCGKLLCPECHLRNSRSWVIDCDCHTI